MGEKLTGRVRHRIGGAFRTKLILQVEGIARDYDHHGGGCFGPEYTYWRDATAKDLTMNSPAAREGGPNAE